MNPSFQIFHISVLCAMWNRKHLTHRWNLCQIRDTANIYKLVHYGTINQIWERSSGSECVWGSVGGSCGKGITTLLRVALQRSQTGQKPYGSLYTAAIDQWCLAYLQSYCVMKDDLLSCQYNFHRFWLGYHPLWFLAIVFIVCVDTVSLNFKTGMLSWGSGPGNLQSGWFVLKRRRIT